MERERSLKIVKNEKDNLLQEAIREAILETRSSDKITDVIENLCFLIEEDEAYQGLDISGISDYELGEKIKKEFKNLRAEIPRHVNSIVGNCYCHMESDWTTTFIKVLDFDDIDFMYKCEAYEIGYEGEAFSFTYYEEITIGIKLLLSCVPLSQCDYCSFQKKTESFIEKMNNEKNEHKRCDILIEISKLFFTSLTSSYIRRIVTRSLVKGSNIEEELKDFKNEFSYFNDGLHLDYDKIVKNIIREETYLINNINPKYV